MLGWMMFYDAKVFKKGKDELSGIILLDEIEHHLHPSWQKQMIKLLSDQFPKLQFITTTHSPLCAIGSANLPDDTCSLVLLTQDDDLVTARDELVPPHGQRADEILSIVVFEKVFVVSFFFIFMPPLSLCLPSLRQQNRLL
jgi:predicted ATP-binding protein involved in virulence